MSFLVVEGTDDLRRASERAAGDLERVVRVVGQEAADAVLSYARPKVPSRSGGARGSLRTELAGENVAVVGGGGRGRHFGWLDFGGRVGIRGSVLRPYSASGRYILPGLRAVDRGGDIERTADREVARSLALAGFEVT
jgi:hypothetical protein